MSMKRAALRVRNRGLYVKPGHYYSPIPSRRDLARPVCEPYGIDLNDQAQRELAGQLAPLMAEMTGGGDPGWRWRPGNNMFGQPDAGVLYGMLAHLRPHKVVEVGSGFSTAVALDCADRHGLDTTFICVEPYPRRLRSLLRPADRVTIVERSVQDVPLEALTDLDAGDVLFIDSTHVVKTGSDVVFLLLQVVPRLKPGVVVHVHDIHWPFTYPQRWLREGRAWNEVYQVQALLIEPPCLRVLLWGSYLAARGVPAFRSSGSIWLARA
jgi:predicted O-methyltransferase YrrM